MTRKYESTTSCAISVPGSFSPAEQQAVLDAAKIAGLDVTRLVTSGCASVYAHCSRHPDTASTVLVVDIGYGYASATVASYSEGNATIHASQCDSEAGSSVIDMAIYNIVAAECQTKYGAPSPTTNAPSLLYR